MSDFEFAIPEQGASVDFTPRVLVSKFGDGYEQRTPDGLNHILEKWSVRFIVDLATGQAIQDFLKERGGSTAFTWTPPEESELLVVCRSWSRARHALHWEIDAVFEEVPA